jgi:hypothetical protein
MMTNERVDSAKSSHLVTDNECASRDAANKKIKEPLYQMQN